MKTFTKILATSLLSGAITLGSYKLFFEKPNETNNNSKGITTTSALPYTHQNVGSVANAIDFTTAAENTINTVVHVKNVSYSVVSNPILEFFYGYQGGQQRSQVGTGSGVIISADGYIVTNNHVIQNASEIEVALNNNKTYKAKLIGTDSKMDIALLKVDADEELPFAVFGDSDNVKVGEWVLAVGNPYNLNSTVTAGIVSAKARSLDQSNSIQSFIQTDAAVNPGNSGGALVNTRGELIGVNTMISSNTGSYVGYSFAVPSNITRKIIEDIMEYGNVQRGILGIEGGELNSAAAKELELSQTEGFYVAKVLKNSGAEKGGLEKGDVILKLDNQKIKSFAELSGYINTKRPDDIINVTVLRKGKEKVLPIALSRSEMVTYEYNGLELQSIDDEIKEKFKTEHGVLIKDVTDESYAELKGKIILSIDGIKMKDMDTAKKILADKSPNRSTKIQVLSKEGKVEWYIFR
ncbi:MAG: trypsin-like peptidase domain-containing protein [Flavobacteriales bacterium]|nr:trypsin-like peptidase domain-containing protein [Flavobacteriales bacterium]